MIWPSNIKGRRWQQALQTKDHYDLYGLPFRERQGNHRGKTRSPFLDDIAKTLFKNFPDWHLRIVGHTDATGDPEPNEALSLARAECDQDGPD